MCSSDLPCSIGTVFGNGLAPNVQGTVNGSQGFGPLPYTLANVSISIAGVAAPIVSVSNSNGQQQVSFQTPCEVRPGPSTVVVNVGAGSTTVQNVAVNAAQPGIFTYLGPNGKVYGVVQSAADGSYVTPTNLARRGGTYFMYVTGLGATTPQPQTNAAGVAGQNVANTVLVGINNAGVPVIGAQYAPGLVGVYYIVFTIPQTSQPGLDQSLVVAEQINGQTIFGNNPLLPGVQ